MKYEVLSPGGRNQRGGWVPERLCSPLERDPGRRALPFFAVMYENVSGVAVFRVPSFSIFCFEIF